MNARTKDFTDKKVKELIAYNTKLGVNDLAYKLTLDSIKSEAKSEADIQSATEYLVNQLIEARLWKISRVSFDTKEIFNNEFLAFRNQLAVKGILLKDKLSTNRFLLCNEATKEYYVVSANISKTSMPKEITEYEMKSGNRGSKKAVKENLK